MDYNYRDAGKRLLQVNPSALGGVEVTARNGCLVPDDEIPGLVSALQNYMSRRAKEITGAAKANPEEGWVWE